MCAHTSQDMPKLKVQASTQSKAPGAHSDARLQRISKQLTSVENVIGNVLCWMVAGLPRRLVTK